MNKSKKIIGLFFLAVIIIIPVQAQYNEIYNKLGSDLAVKVPGENEKFIFGGFYNEAKALVYFDRFWVEGRIGLKFSLDGNNVGKVTTMPDRTQGNVGWTPFTGSEFVFGTNYYKMVPGTYMNAYDDVLPSARYGKNGFTYVFSGLKDETGVSLALNVPFQDSMFTGNHGVDVNGAVIYEGEKNINFGTTFYTDFSDDYSVGAYASGGAYGSPFVWMAGYTLNGKGINNATPADHYFDTTIKITREKFSLSADFEVGVNNSSDGKIPLYAGILGIYFPVPTVQVKLGAMYTLTDASDYHRSNNVLFLYPRVLIGMGKHEFAVGTQVTLLDTSISDSPTLGFAFPVHWKYNF